MTDDRELHPNLAEALDAAEADTAELQAIVRLLADLPGLEAPPAGLFDAIAAEAFGNDAAASPVSAPSPLQSVTSASSATARRSMAPPAVHPRRRWPVLAAAAAVVIVLGTAGVALLGTSDDAPIEQQVELVALPGFEQVEASARFVERGSEREVEVDLSGVDLPEGSHLELWLLDPAVSQTISLGVLDGDGPFSVPADVDLVATPIVDISVEPDDGDAAHSGVSVVRGEIDPS